jgi:penicillin G amidase
MRARLHQSRPQLRKVLRVILLLVVVMMATTLVTGVWAYRKLEASLPQLEGRQTLPGLSAAVRVDRDALGIPTIHARSREDLALATGFLHAQDRFFQMDLSRRRAAGELSEIFGELAVEIDRDVRRHRFRAVTRRVLDRIPAEERALLEAYAEGANQGLASLGAKPFEYFILRTEPEPWRAEDSFLVLESMFLALQSTGEGEEALGLMRDLLPAELVRFLHPAGTAWDAPLIGPAFAAAPIPGPEVFDLHSTEGDSPDQKTESKSPPGSNNWAVAGAWTADGGALLANDMHLPLRVPNTWYRASFVLDGKGESRQVTGVTMPGIPVMVVGSNGKIAWGFTNTMGDWSDLILLEPDPENGVRYLTPSGPREFEYFEETIEVKGGEDLTVDIPWTIWGPVWGKDVSGRDRALSWVAHQDEVINMHHLGFETVETIEQAIELAHGDGIPAQNLVVADAGGRIAWTILGSIPRRVGFDGSVPTSWADGTRRWDGWLKSDEYPALMDPPKGRLWSANARTVDGDDLRKMGDGGYGLGARAAQIRDRLFELEHATPKDLLAIQLDDRALLLAPWRELLLELLDPATTDPLSARGRFRDHVQRCEGKAKAASVGYRLVKEFRAGVFKIALAPLVAPCRELDETFDLPGGQGEGAVWQLVTEQPIHLLDPKFESWQALMLSVVDSQLERGELDAMTWGKRNRSAIKHPLSTALPFLSEYLDMPPLELDGDVHMPRVQGRYFGASQRMIVSPGREEEGIFHMPAGQCGHPLSPHYRDSHMAWVNGEATPFLPGEAVHTLVLEP